MPFAGGRVSADGRSAQRRARVVEIEQYCKICPARLLASRVMNVITLATEAYSSLYTAVQEGIYAGLDMIGLGQSQAEREAGEQLYYNVTNPGWWVKTLSARFGS